VGYYVLGVYEDAYLRYMWLERSALIQTSVFLVLKEFTQIDKRRDYIFWGAISSNVAKELKTISNFKKRSKNMMKK